MLKKKELQKEQIKKMLAQYPIVVWCQRAQKPTYEWLRIKKELEKNLNLLHELKQNTKYNFFQTKSTLLQSVLNTSQQYKSSCQGHIALYGCNTPVMLKVFMEIMSKENCGFVLGGIYDKKSRSFKELKKLQNLNEFSYLNCTKIFQNTMQRLFIVEALKDFSYLSMSGCRLLMTLHSLKESLKEKEEESLINNK